MDPQFIDYFKKKNKTLFSYKTLASNTIFTISQICRLTASVVQGLVDSSSLMNIVVVWTMSNG